MLLNILYNAHRKLEPTIDVVTGEKYPFAEDILGVKPGLAKKILGRLSDDGYLMRELCNVVLKCPDCGGYWLVLRLHCPYCNSFKLEKGESIKHYECGYVGFKSEFIRGNEYVCPRCNKKLEKLGTEYRLIGTWYMCHDCSEKFGEPKETLLCNYCKKEYEVDKLILEGIYMYSVNESAVKELFVEFDLNKIVEAFKDEWEVSIPAKVDGASGITHIFSGSLLSKGMLRKEVLFDIEYDAEAVGPDAVMRFFAKTADVKSDLFVLTGIPKFTLDAKELARAYKINILEGDKIESVLANLKEIVESIVEGRE